MTTMTHFECFNQLAIAMPEAIQQPALKQLAERLQTELLTSIEVTTSPLVNTETPRVSREHILDRLYQTPIADASVLVAITNEPKPKLLLTRRAAHMNSHAGEVSCAGGRHEKEDGSNMVTALREAYEETALPPNKVQIIGQLPPQTSKSGMSVRPIVALIEPELVLVPEVGEIARIFWADFTTLITQPIVEHALNYTMLEQTATIVTPSWNIDGETVWGLTGRVLANLLEIGFDRQFDWYYRMQETDKPSSKASF